MKKHWIFHRVSLHVRREDGSLDLRPWRNTVDAAGPMELNPSRRQFLRHSAVGAGGLGLASVTGTLGLSWLWNGSAAAATVVPTGDVVIHAAETIIRSRRELIMFHGQSNAVGTGGSPALTLQQIYANVTFNGGVRPGTDASAMTSLVPLVEYDGGHGTGGEVGTNACADGLVEYIATLSGVPASAQYSRYSAFTSGEGGRPIGYFATFLEDSNPGGYQGWDDSKLRLTSMLALMRAEGQKDGSNIGWLATTWQQGEADSTGLSETRATYKTKLTALERAHWLKLCQVYLPEQSWRPLWMIAQVCSHNSYGATSLAFCNPFIALAQRDACLASPYMRMVNPQYMFDYFDESSRGQPMLHLNNESHRWQGRYFARALYQLIQDRSAGVALRNPALDMLTAVKVNATTINLVFNVPAGVLTLDTSWVAPTRNYGLDVRDANNKLVPAGPGDNNLIAGVRVVASDTLQVSLKTELPDTAAKVTLGWGDPAEPASLAGRKAGPRSNIRDSAGEADFYVASNGSKRPMHNYALVADVALGWVGRVQPAGEWHFNGNARSDIIDQSGSGSAALTLIGRPSFTASGVQSANNTQGFQTDIDETASITFAAIFSSPYGVGPSINAGRAVSTYQGFSPHQAGSALQHEYDTARANSELTSFRLAVTGSEKAVTSGPAQAVDTRYKPRFAIVSIDATTGSVRFLCPSYEEALREETYAGLANRPLNGKVLINAWKDGGDAAEQGAILTRYAAIWTRALSFEEMLAEYEYARGLYGAV
ncbi:twin-arginine translocation signal domain-containing protein [Pinirhizobacter sp.]|uniref:twin-arginine translocation signal domain-containing protein n=1 Tax=Pinirhizobacter sp. TaxID=2950432 RepID=UPI002F3F6303